MVDRMLSELAASAGPFVLIIDDLHELSSGYRENAWAGVKAHLDTVTERGRAHHREIHRVLAAADIEVFITTTTFAIMQSLRLDRAQRTGPPLTAAGHRSFPVLKVRTAGSGVPARILTGSARSSPRPAVARTAQGRRD